LQCVTSLPTPRRELFTRERSGAGLSLDPGDARRSSAGQLNKFTLYLHP
jgi:hypothetical protein